MKRRKDFEISVTERIAKLPTAEKLAMKIQGEATGAVDVVTAISRPHPRFREQKGEIITYANGIYLRYQVTNKASKRVKFPEYLCPLGTDQREVNKLKKKRMKEINFQQRSEFFVPTANDLTVDMYWQSLHYPHIEANKSYSTALTYKRTYDNYLKTHFEKKSLERYKTSDGHNLLEALAKLKDDKGNQRLGENTISLCRAICYGIFKRAKNKDLISVNPWEDVDRPDVKVKEAGEAIAYTLEEIAQAVKLIPRVDAKLLFSFCSLLGMRPGEAAAVRWEAIGDDGMITIDRSAPRGHLQLRTKNKKIRRVALIKPVAWLLEQYREEWRKDKRKLEGYLFTRRDGSVINVSDWQQYNISRHCDPVLGDRWQSLYAGRRAAGTALYNLHGDARATFQVLGNANGYKYIQPSNEQGKAGLLLLEAAFEAADGKL